MGYLGIVRSASMTHVIAFDELDAKQVDRVGRKCANLAELMRAGFPVPAGFAITREQQDVGDSVAAAYAALGDDVSVAIRSDADTVLWVTGVDSVLEHIRRLAGTGIAVQRMVDARVAGVMFTLNPASGDRSSIVVDASWGSGSTVVRGEVTPDSYVVSKETREVLLTDVGGKEVEYIRGVMHEVDANRRRRRCLDRGELERLADLGVGVEQHYGKPQELEWALEGDDLFLLQARPVTVWAHEPRVVLPFE